MPSSSQVYATNGFSEHQAQDNFSRQYDMADPEAARHSYQRVMHQHTKQQFETATASSRRRSSGAASTNGIASLSTQSSNASNGSISSTAS